MTNIIKNINPPIELTQSQYNNLSESQKNSGIIYYINDGNQNSFNASELITNNSNTQAELDNYNTNINNLISGQTLANTANYLKIPSSTGISTDQYGNLIMNSQGDASNYWTIFNHDKSLEAIAIHFNTGRWRFRNRIFCYGKGDTFSSAYAGVGFLSSAQTEVTIMLPIVTSATSATLTKLTLWMSNGINSYAFMKYGANAGSSIGINNRVIWQNSAQVYDQSINNVTVSIIGNRMIKLSVLFKNPLYTTSGTTKVNNNIPIMWQGIPVITFS